MPRLCSSRQESPVCSLSGVCNRCSGFPAHPTMAAGPESGIISYKMQYCLFTFLFCDFRCTLHRSQLHSPPPQSSKLRSEGFDVLFSGYHFEVNREAGNQNLFDGILFAPSLLFESGPQQSGGTWVRGWELCDAAGCRCYN